MQVTVNKLIMNSSAKKELKRKQEKKDQELRFLSNAIYKTLRDEGCEANDIIGVSSGLIALVINEMEELKK